ncbi:MAG: 6-bladed beta-propeller, partial [Odoribacter sp.]|nr:6-bladed beta-propeller [Odoribacter sp.]
SPCLTQIRQADLNHPIEKISDIVQDIDFIKIEDGELYTNLAGEIILWDGKSRQNFKAYPSGFLLLNTDLQFNVYDTCGNFKFKFGQYGRGPGEYTAAWDFCHDPYNNRYYVASNTGLYVYDSTGHWLYTRPYLDKSTIITHMEASSPNSLVACGTFQNATGRQHAYFTLDTAGHVHEIPHLIKQGQTHLSAFDNRFSCLLNDSIFQINNDTLSLQRCFQFSADKPFPLRFYSENDTYGVLHAIAGEIVDEEYVSLILSKKDKHKFFLISSKTQDDCFLNLNRGVYGFVIDAWGFINNQLIVTIPATEFRDLVEKATENPEKYPYLEKAKKIADGLTDDSNSIIAKVSLKQFP